jgi:hypothetical protein
MGKVSVLKRQARKEREENLFDLCVLSALCSSFLILSAFSAKHPGKGRDSPGMICHEMLEHFKNHAGASVR